MPNFNLIPRQELAARAITEGATMTAVALKASVSRRVLYNWKENLPDFRTAIDTFRLERRQTMTRQAEAAARQSVEVLAASLTNDSIPPASRARAALAILAELHRNAHLQKNP